MLSDRYGNRLTTTSSEARDAYVAAVDLLLAANPGAEQAFDAAISCDPGLAVAHAGLARTLQIQARPQEAKAAITRGLELAPGLSARERGHLEAFGLLIHGKPAEALAAARRHLDDYPRDAMVLAPCTSVFGLIGFSGRAGREGELLALMEPLATVYGEEDWWFLACMPSPRSNAGKSRRRWPTSSARWPNTAQRPRRPHSRPRLLRERRARGGPDLPA